MPASKSASKRGRRVAAEGGYLVLEVRVDMTDPYEGCRCEGWVHGVSVGLGSRF